jgi:hypothetical protein
MKNVHLLPTDKPSRLAGSEYITNEQGIDKRVLKFKLWDKLIPNKDLKDIGYIPQNIYITNDEEIKVGDWYYLPRTNSFYKCNEDPTELNLERRLGVAKIILTTDPDLIAEGVQPIDDEFLQWFVKNPSCEFVEVGYGWIRLTETDNEGYWVSIPDKQFEMQQEEPKQETNLEDSIYQAIGLAANEQGIINQALATSKVMDVLKKTNL